jgi:hypothetical protein
VAAIDPPLPTSMPFKVNDSGVEPQLDNLPTRIMPVPRLSSERSLSTASTIGHRRDLHPAIAEREDLILTVRFARTRPPVAPDACYPSDPPRRS